MTSMVHEASWNSFIRIPNYSVHEVRWNSSGAVSLVLSTHTTAWTSSFSVNITQTTHTTAWTSSFSVHSTQTTSYQSVVEDFTTNTQTWKSFTQENVGIHESRYRSYTLDPQFILANAYIELEISP
jgi:hypothetical protein